MKDLCLLVVDDDELVIQAVRLALPEQWRMLSSNNPLTIPERGFQAALVDMHLSGNLAVTEGVELIRKLSQKHPHLEIIAMSGNLDRELMEQCLRAGATRFLAKPLSIDEVQLTLKKIEAWFLLQGATNRTVSTRHRWIGSGRASREIQRQIAQLRNEPGPILIEGESGTGKEVTAQLIHAQDERQTLIAVNVAALPDNLFESEFFGHTKGAFTGAEQNKMGLAEAAHGGDLFLDEIEALSLHHQAKMLRFLETGEVRRVGAKDTIQVQTRVIVATNRNLNQMVSEGKFREDLLWRLSGKRIVLPPLRERLDDLEELTRHFLSVDRSGRRKDIADDALQVFRDYHWPGNVRELKRVCEQLVLLAPLPVIRAQDVLRVIQPMRGSVSQHNIDFRLGLPALIEQFESEVIRQALDAHEDIDELAKYLKISRSSLYKKIKDYNLQIRGA